MEAVDSLPVTGIKLPNETALTSLFHLLTGKSKFPASRLEGAKHSIYKLDYDVCSLIESLSLDELMDIGAQWAYLSPWVELDVNPVDLAGFMAHLKSLWDQSSEPEKSVFLWFNT